MPGTILFLFFGAAFGWLGSTRLSDLGALLYAVIMGGGFMVVGLWGIYRITTILINRTAIEIASDRLSVRHGPLPYPGNCSVACSELKEICVEKRAKAGIPLFLPVEGGGGDFTPKTDFYELRAVLKDGRELKLVYGSDDDTIHYLKAAMTRNLRPNNSSPTTIIEVIPAGLEVRREFDSFTVTYRWFSWMKMLLYLPLVITSTGILILTGTVMGRPAAAEPPDFFVQIAPLAVLLMVLCGAYMSLVTALNRTTIEISSERVCVRHGPLPYPGNRSVACVDLQELAVEERKHKSDEPATYQLSATLKTGEKVALWSNANRPRLDYLKRAIERQLGRSAINAAPA